MPSKKKVDKRPQDEKSDIDHPPSKTLHSDTDSARQAQVQVWLKQLKLWVRFARLANISDGADTTETEDTSVDHLPQVTMGRLDGFSPELRQTAGEIVRAVERDPAVLPIELRQLYGFPPADTEVLEYLLLPKEMDECQTAILCFLKTLYDELASLIEQKGGKQEYADMADWFRGYMATWTHMKEPSSTRRQFFKSVVEKSKQMWQEMNQSPHLSARERSCKSRMIDSFEKFSARLQPDKSSRKIAAPGIGLRIGPPTQYCAGFRAI
ncbi:hypothetical protein DACRYDRAFT_107189 [Dacryopinax primogenitus]|uniref:Uncharacterized protein n=1 Tax=Dacryopinax primogenitus (strain DJM 731) TaxID=1858805 RepID=M5G0J4_DACPD|nr:uncharacterized protein DACRYDRAFT_107189 [Dacryopinax primogenitus]EJU02259.1 hypothetical protein DACRYDRAFT_107189 [Dacryopinax primogenitus]